MAILTWNDEYRIGIEEVDHQHQGLVDMINRLDAAINDGEATEVVMRLLVDLKAYTHYHFSTEEHMMREGGCPSGHMRLHLRQHRDFERSLDQFARAYNVSGAVVAGSLLEFLLKWLMSHIMGSDKEMGRLMRGEDAAPAADMSSAERERWLQRQLDQEIAQRNMLSALREAESRFRVIADSVPVLIWMGDSGGGRSFFNKTWLDFTGRSVDAESGWGWLSSVHPDDRSGLLETFRQALAARQEYSVEYRLRRHEADYCWMVEKGVPRSTARGTFTGFIGSTTDITARKEAELSTAQACARVEAEAESRLAKVRQLAEKLQRIRARLDAGGPDGHLERVMEDLVAEIDEALAIVAACLPEPEAVCTC